MRPFFLSFFSKGINKLKLIGGLAEDLITQSARVTESRRRAESHGLGMGEREGGKGWWWLMREMGVREAEIAKRPPDST